MSRAQRGRVVRGRDILPRRRSECRLPVQTRGKLLTTGSLLSGIPSSDEEPSHESQHCEDEEDEEEDLRQPHELARQSSEAKDGADQGDDKERDSQTENCTKHGRYS